MGIASLGGSASASNTLSNIINFNPNIQYGRNSNDLASNLDQRASSEALVKDEAKFSASAGVGIGGGSGSGGPASLSDSSGMASALPNVFSESFANAKNNTPLIIAGVGGGIALIIGALALKKKRK